MDFAWSYTWTLYGFKNVLLWDSESVKPLANKVNCISNKTPYRENKCYFIFNNLAILKYRQKLVYKKWNRHVYRRY